MATKGEEKARENAVVACVPGLDASDGGEGPTVPTSKIEEQLGLLTDMLQKQQKQAQEAAATDAPPSPDKANRSRCRIVYEGEWEGREARKYLAGGLSCLSMMIA